MIFGLLVPSAEIQGKENDAIKQLTLNQAIEEMLKDNTTLKQTKLDLEQAKVNYDKNQNDLRKAKKTYGSKDDNSLSYLQYVKLLEITSEFGMKNAERNLTATEEKLKADVEKAYYQLIQAEEVVTINQENLDQAETLLNNTIKKFDLGLIAKQEVLTSQLGYIEAKNEYSASVNNYKKAMMNFNMILGYDLTTEVDLIDELTMIEFNDIDIEAAVTQALENRNEVKAAEFQYELDKVNFAITAKTLPDITYQYRSQELLLKADEENLDNAKKGVEFEVRSNYLDIIEKQEKIKEQEKAVELATEALKINEISYENGLNLITDVQKAQSTLKQSKLGLSSSILEYNLAVQNFEDSIGVGRTAIVISMQ